MNSRLKDMTRTIWVLGLLGFFVSCQDTIPKRSLITSGSSFGDTPVCDVDEELVTEKVDGVDKKVCVEKVLKRPDNAVFWKPDYCICKDNKAISYGNCATFCSSKDTKGAEILYASFNVADSISLDNTFGNVQGWCQTPLETDRTNPGCALQAKDEAGNIIPLNELNFTANTNSITTNVQGVLAFDKTYVLTLVEKSSGAKSDSLQMIKFSTDMSLPVIGPLKAVPVTQYTCLVREFSTDSVTGDIYYEKAYRLHFYFIPRLAPDKVPGGITELICHDIFNPLYGQEDDETYPRLEQLPGTITLWDETDPRFHDNNGNKLMDINEAIIQKTKNFGATVPADSVFFRPFTWFALQFDQEAGNNSANEPKKLGFYMPPWIDQTTFKSYCLNSTHYNSSNALFKAMRDYIGMDTEGLYAAEKSAETVKDSDGNTTSGFKDLILIRETDLKAVWFYLKSQVPTVPTDTNVANNPIYFYYPLNKASPFVKTSTQRIYRVRSMKELAAANTSAAQGTSSTSSGTTTAYEPHDRKIGCIPKF